MDTAPKNNTRITRKLPGFYESPNFTIHLHRRFHRQTQWEVEAATTAGRAVLPQKKIVISLTEAKKWVVAYEQWVRAWERSQHTVKRSLLATIRMVAGQEKKYHAVVCDGRRIEWVGIGWIDVRAATMDDYTTLPVAIEDNELEGQ
jgi:hypothetical protein